MTRSHGLDSTWKTEARCAGKSNNPNSPWYDAWFIEPKGKRNLGGAIVRGTELIKVALDICMHCPVQWDCATYALDSNEPQGTWGMAFEDLRWVKKQKNAREIIDTARELGVAVQVAVPAVRHNLG